MQKTVLSKLINGVRTVTLNRPNRLNAINASLIRDLHDTLADAQADLQTDVIVLRGAGRAFCSGDDLIEFSETATSEKVARKYIEDIQDITRLITLKEKVVIAAVHGWAVGGGFEWLINCDVVLMAEKTKCFFPETSLGMVVTGAATTLLPRIVGLHRARSMILLGEKINASDALKMGLAWRVCEEASLFDEAQALGEKIAKLPERGVRDSKRLLNNSDSVGIEEALCLEVDAVVPAFVDPATATRVASFKE